MPLEVKTQKKRESMVSEYFEEKRKGDLKNRLKDTRLGNVSVKNRNDSDKVMRQSYLRHCGKSELAPFSVFKTSN